MPVPDYVTLRASLNRLSMLCKLKEETEGHLFLGTVKDVRANS